MRFIISFFLAFVVSIFIFLAMDLMTKEKDTSFKESKKLPHLVYLKQKQDETIQKKKRIKPKEIIEKPKNNKIKIIKTKISTNIKQDIKIKPFSAIKQSLDISKLSTLSDAKIAVEKQKLTTFIDAGSLSTSQRINPSYPRNAKRRNIQGFVQLGFDINAKGQVINIKVLKSNPKDVFEKNAINALRRWKFQRKNIQNVSINFNFRLK